MRDKKAHVSVTYCCITNHSKSCWLQKNNLIFLVILPVLPELIHVIVDSSWLCWGWLISGGLTHMDGASGAKVGTNSRWVAGPLSPLSPQASSLESRCWLRWQKQGLWGLTSLTRSCHILLVKWTLRPTLTNSEDRDHRQMEGAGNNLWPFKIHQHLQTGLSLCYLVSCVVVTFSWF